VIVLGWHRRIVGLALSAVLAAGCGSVGGLVGFPPATADNTPPAVVSFLPPADGTAPADSPVTVTFNKAMSAGGFEIVSEPPLSFGPGQWSDDEKTVSARPTPGFAPGTIYTIRVRARDRRGTPLATDLVWRFTATAPTAVGGEGRLRLADRIEVGMDARVFTLFAALLALAPDAAAGSGHPVRTAVSARMASLPARMVDPLRKFWADRPAPLEQYLAATLDLSPPPDLREGMGTSPASPGSQPGQRPAVSQPGAPPGGRTPVSRPTATAPSGRDLSGLGPVLTQFYVGAGIADLWRAHGKAYEEAVDAHRRDAPGLLGRTMDYLRAVAVPGARITILPNLLASPGEGYLVRRGDRPVLVVAGSRTVDRLALVRPFVRLLLDPIRDQAVDAVRRGEPLFAQARDVAARHGYRTWPEVVAESLFEAIAIRVALDTDEAQAALRAAYARGLVLVDHFTAQLADYERTTTVLTEFYPRMVAAIDLDVELRRWAERKPN
jgi:hypothetical protein